MVHKCPDTASRLAFVMQACGYPTDAAFADSLDLRPQNLRNWRERNSIGRASLERIREVTGASIDWMVTGKGEPFPEGPIRYAGASSSPDLATRLDEAEANIDALVAVTGTLIQALARLAPDEVEAVAAAVRKALQAPGVAPDALPTLLRVAEEAAAAGAPAAGASRRKRQR